MPVLSHDNSTLLDYICESHDKGYERKVDSRAYLRICKRKKTTGKESVDRRRQTNWAENDSEVG